MTEIKDRRYGKRSGLQNQCAVPDMIDLSSIYPCCLRRKFTSIRIPRGRCRDAGKDDKMSVEYSPHGAGTAPSTIFRNPKHRTVASYEQELRRHRRTEIGLREALAREEILLCQKEELIQHQAVLSQESDHRLLNSVQMIVSLLSLQGRASENAEVASQLAAAADRRCHDRAHPPSSPLIRPRTNLCIQAIYRGPLS